MEYEMVREIPNLCRNNQMRDVFFEEIETDDPVAYVRGFLKGKEVELSSEARSDGGVTVFENITDVVIGGKPLGLGGYLDIGLYDTMEDLLVNFIVAVCKAAKSVEVSV